ncbi:hypothetical protein B0T19DRAFT_271282 [Cercophora scortea]|uniref:Uncharacterized protein n=1 Tax=Cercophora scortea TaxID=314031 RepID=A0AAE0I7A3_9PEZI|nr:hypothetical protein B0T19DRAFT_271282 [Cercophora scortea]
MAPHGDAIAVKPSLGSAPVNNIKRAAFQAIRQIGALVTRDDNTDAKCHPQPNINLCETTGSSNSKSTIWIVIGCCVGILFVATLAVLGFLHIRKTKRDKLEDQVDQFRMADYGLDIDDLPGTTSKKFAQDAQRKRSLDEGTITPSVDGTRSRDPMHAGPLSPPRQPAAAASRGHMNPFVSPADDEAVSVRSADQQWPQRDDSTQKR